MKPPIVFALMSSLLLAACEPRMPQKPKTESSAPARVSIPAAAPLAFVGVDPAG